MSLRVAVTGGSGFIGSHLVDRLVGRGHEVVVLDDRPVTWQSDVQAEKVDITSLSDVTRVLSGCDAVYHLAAVSNVDVAFRDPVKTVEINILGLANVLEAARRNDVGRVVFASTVWVYTGVRDDGPLTEEMPFHLPDAGHVYTSSKIAGEMIVHNYQSLYGLDATILRYGIPFGPRMREELVIPIFVRRALNGEPIVIQGDGAQYRNYVYVDDLVEANVLAMAPEAANRVYNLEGPERISIRRIAETIRDAMGGAVHIEFQPARPGDYRGHEVSAERASDELGWNAKVSFDEGMRRYIDWYRQNLGT